MRLKLRTLVPCFLLLTSATMLFVSWETPKNLDPPEEASGEFFQVGNLTLKTIISPPPDMCKNIDTLILVPSAPKNFKRRSNIRQTWGNFVGPGSMNPNIDYLFVMGEFYNINSMKRISREDEQYHDVLLFNFHDAYLNLTTKIIAGYSWALDNCETVSIIGKVDDDVVFNVNRLESYFNGKNVTEEALFVMGPKNKGLDVVRDIRSKWYVSEEIYPKKKFPQYAAGFVYFVSALFAEAIVESHKGIPPLLGIDDAYLTGIVATELKAAKSFDDMNVPGKLFAIGCKFVQDFVEKSRNVSDVAFRDPVNSFPIGVECHRSSLVRTIHTVLSGEHPKEEGINIFHF